MLKVTITGKLSKQKVQQFLQGKVDELGRQLQLTYPELRQILVKGLVKFESRIEVAQTNELVEIFSENSFDNATAFLKKAANFYDDLSLQSKEVAGPDHILAELVADTNFIDRVKKLLIREGVKTLGQLLEKTEEDLLRIRGFGKRCLEDVVDTLDTRSLALKNNIVDDSGM